MVDFSSVILEDRKNRELPKFKGNVLDYLHILEKDPGIYQLAHERIYNLLISRE